MKKKSGKQARVRFTVSVDAALVTLARTAVHQTKGLTLASLVNTGLRLAIMQLERHRGRRFRPTLVRLPVGRPRKRVMKKGARA